MEKALHEGSFVHPRRLKNRGSGVREAEIISPVWMEDGGWSMEDGVLRKYTESVPVLMWYSFRPLRNSMKTRKGSGSQEKDKQDPGGGLEQTRVNKVVLTDCERAVDLSESCKYTCTVTFGV